MKFTQIPDKLNYPYNIKSKLSTLHSDIVTYVISNFTNTNRYKTKIVNLLNTISYYIVTGDSFPVDWDIESPLENIEFIDQSICETTLGDIYLHVRDIKWDVVETKVNESPNSEISKEHSDNKIKSEIRGNSLIKSKVSNNTTYSIEPKLTPKEDLYIRPPIVPQIDVTKPWLSYNINNTIYTIYTSLPEIPLNQCQISVTTDISKMTANDLNKLFPNHLIRTRSSVMYERYGDLEYDEKLGVIIPIEGFTTEQIKENIIKYPHLFKLMKIIDGNIVNFYSTIEINGEIHNVLDVWDDLPDSQKMPKNSEYIKEYVVRKYLLEEDIKHIQHKYKMFGDLYPFLTLFTTQSDYVEFGFSDTLQLAKSCVNSRVRYKQSRNPILRLVNNE